jgi:hypothetical protein
VGACVRCLWSWIKFAVGVCLYKEEVVVALSSYLVAAFLSDQSEHNGYKWPAHFRFLAPSLAAQRFGCFVLLGTGPC